MTTWVRRAIALAAVLAATAPAAAFAQSIAPTVPDDPHRRGSLGMPFPGVAFDVEVLGPNRFVLAVDDGETERVQIFTAMGGFEGAPFSPGGEADEIQDVVAARGGGYWVAWRRSEDGTLSLRRFDGAGRPQGEAVTLPASDLGREASLFPLAEGGVLAVWSQGRRPSGDPYPPLLGLPSRLTAAAVAVAVAPDGTTSEPVALDPFTSFDVQRFITGLVLPDGSVVVGWAEEIGSGGFGTRLVFTQFDPDGSRMGHPVQLWSPSPRRAHASFLSLVPIRGEAGFAAVFALGREFVVQRFGPDGAPTTGLTALPNDPLAHRPLYVDGAQVVAVGSLDGPDGVFRLSAEGRTDLHVTLQHSVAEAVEEDGSVVAAYQTSSGDAQFSYLHRVVME